MGDNFVGQSAFSRRRKLYEFIRNGQHGPEVLDELLPQGQPHLYEKQLWDYKLELPYLPTVRKATEAEKQSYQAGMAEIVKDVVSFYNSYGGYLVIGVGNQPREIVGFERHFDCGDLIRLTLSATRHEVDCHFALIDCETPSGKKRVGLLLIPRRAESMEPAQFLRDAPASDNGKRAYRRNDIYFRQGDECRPAKDSEDYSFLCSQGRRQFLLGTSLGLTTALSNNLGPRDPGFIRFIGREEYLQKLWYWLCEKYKPCKVLTGLGGVGKTTIAREFSEELTRNSPFGLEAVIWLSAKQQFFAAGIDKFMPASRVDFENVDTMLRKLYLELGSPDETLDHEWARDELMEEVVKTLRVMPALVVVDDVDTLEVNDQQDMFHTMLNIMGRTMGTGQVPSRALLTSRLDLGAAEGQKIHVEGLSVSEFAEYVEMTAKNMNLPWTLGRESKLMKKFRQSTDGSPIFAASILRLAQLGESLDKALVTWKGSSGEKVRKFAFDRELGKLDESQARTLYGACILRETSLLELQQVTESNDTLLRDDIAELRKYHLLASGNDAARGGTTLIVPSGIRLMIDQVKTHVRDPKRLERACLRARAASPQLTSDHGSTINLVIALLRANKQDEALEVAQIANKKYRDDPNLQCLLGRVHLRTNPPDPRNADMSFRRAYELGCSRTELMRHWIEAKQQLQDWIGVIEVTRLADKRGVGSQNVLYRVRAYNILGDLAVGRGDLDGATKHYLDGVGEINDGFREERVRGCVAELKDLRDSLLENYLMLVDRMSPEPDEYLNIWLATYDAFKFGLRHPMLLEHGAEKLKTWWRAVEGRDRHDPKAEAHLRKGIENLGFMTSRLTSEGWPYTGVITSLQSAKRILTSGLSG